MAAIDKTKLYARAKRGQISACESRLGFRLPLLLKRIFLEVSNGGFGPGYGLFGVINGHSDDNGRKLAEIYQTFVAEHENDEKGWPAGLLPLCEWGSGIWSCVDCTTLRGNVITYSDDGLTDTGDDLVSWLHSWQNGESLWNRMFEIEEKDIVNPFTKKPKRIATRGRAIGQPFVR